jgi:type VI secretion system protein VasG
MAEISRVAVFGKLNPLVYKAVEGATVFCKLRGNPYVELEHWIAQIVQNPDSDWHRIIQHHGLDVSVLAKDITAALDRLPRGATAISDISDSIDTAVREAWVFATLMYKDSSVRSGYILLAMLKTKSLRNALFAISRQFEKIKPDDLADDLPGIVKGSAEDGQAAADGSGAGAPGEASGAIAPAAMGKQEALKKFTTDLTEQARGGKMDPIVGRDDEIRQVVDILMRRRQNNPILVGEAGVGKTAVVEGFAQRIARGDVPPALKDVKLLTLDVGLLQAGASMKGEFEQRLRSVIEEVQASPQAHHPVHRRDAHAGGRGRRGWHRRRGQPAQARAGARHAAHHRCHHLCRIQEAHREGPGADTPLPDRAGRRARREEGHADDARRGQHDGKAPQGADP